MITNYVFDGLFIEWKGEGLYYQDQVNTGKELVSVWFRALDLNIVEARMKRGLPVKYIEQADLVSAKKYFGIE